MTAWARYLTPGPVHRGLGLVCVGVGACAGKVAPVRDRTLDSFAGVLITAGKGRLRWDGRDCPIRAPALFWLRPGVRHTYAPDPAGWHEWWVLFDGPAIDSYTRLGYLSPAEPVLPLVHTGPLENAFAAVARACRPDRVEADVDAAAALHHLLVTTRRCAHPQGVPDAVVVARLLGDASSTTTVREHARRLGMSVPALRDAVRRATGHNPKEYQLRARLNRAKELLVTTDLTVAAVARRVGYDDPAHFTRVFARRVGVAPSRFRREQRRSLADPGDEF